MSDLEVLMLVLAVGIVSSWVTWKVSANYHANIFTELMDRLGVTEEEMIGIARDMSEETGVPFSDAEQALFDSVSNEGADELEIYIEQVEGHLMAYRKDDSTFIAQGSNSEELLDRLTKVYKVETRLIVSEEDGANLLKEKP